MRYSGAIYPFVIEKWAYAVQNRMDFRINTNQGVILVKSTLKEWTNEELLNDLVERVGT